MTKQDPEKERLLGYLLNALDDQEAAQVKRELSQQPHLRSELATLQRDLAPLNYIADSVEPPPQLAKRTCAQIWETLDNEGHDKEDLGKGEREGCQAPDAPPQMDSVLGFVFDPFKTVVAIPTVDLALPKVTKHVEATQTKPPKSKFSYWIGLVVSVSLGMVAAFFLFPMIRYAERSTRSYVTENWMSEIHRRVDQYEQIHGNPSQVPRLEETLPFNLALYGWQELHAEALTLFPLSEAKPVLSFDDLRIQRENVPSDRENSNEIIRGQHSPPLGGFHGWNKPIPLDTNDVSDHLLLSIPGQENSVRSAFGQDILLKEGRIFFRILPSAEPPKK